MEDILVARAVCRTWESYILFGRVKFNLDLGAPFRRCTKCAAAPILHGRGQTAPRLPQWLALLKGRLDMATFPNYNLHTDILFYLPDDATTKLRSLRMAFDAAHPRLFQFTALRSLSLLHADNQIFAHAASMRGLRQVCHAVGEGWTDRNIRRKGIMNNIKHLSKLTQLEELEIAFLPTGQAWDSLPPKLRILRVLGRFDEARDGPHPSLGNATKIHDGLMELRVDNFFLRELSRLSTLTPKLRHLHIAFLTYLYPYDDDDYFFTEEEEHFVLRRANTPEAVWPALLTLTIGDDGDRDLVFKPTCRRDDKTRRYNRLLTRPRCLEIIASYFSVDTRQRLARLRLRSANYDEQLPHFDLRHHFAGLQELELSLCHYKTANEHHSAVGAAATNAHYLAGYVFPSAATVGELLGHPNLRRLDLLWSAVFQDIPPPPPPRSSGAKCPRLANYKPSLQPGLLDWVCEVEWLGLRLGWEQLHLWDYQAGHHKAGLAAVAVASSVLDHPRRPQGRPLTLAIAGFPARFHPLVPVIHSALRDAFPQRARFVWVEREDPRHPVSELDQHDYHHWQPKRELRCILV